MISHSPTPFRIRSRRRGKTKLTEVTLDGELVVAFEQAGRSATVSRIETIGPTAAKLVESGHFAVMVEAIGALVAGMTPEERAAFAESFLRALGKTCAQLTSSAVERDA